MKYQILFVLCVLVVGCASNKTSPYVEYVNQPISIPANSAIAIKVEEFEIPPFRGQVNYDNLDVNHGQMAYIGVTPGAFAGSILAHALIVGAAGDSKKKAEQEEADKILDLYREAIATFTAANLTKAAVVDFQQKNIAFNVWEAENSDPWIVQSYPMFFLSQDRSTLTLKNSVSIFEKNNRENPAYQNLIEVVSSPVNEDKSNVIPVAALNELSIKLFVDSLVVMKTELSGEHKLDSKEKTLSFYSGGKKVYERGRILSESCDRMSFRTLRGWVKSVPIERKAQTCSVS
ncbi:hypothetical protein [Microbulbifer sp. THAF38]|uniref:hypothetical protein n=1 Tax=Microbulbifer sp. THAF38 TaxID=2587856 RepID=UPI0012685EBE|nr:hypothetical protein [Microbulbifer sp. THAF38]QFT57000.1 hypothetical protein FIU95_20845 [Microbulbifer sp. THAF38]